MGLFCDACLQKKCPSSSKKLKLNSRKSGFESDSDSDGEEDEISQKSSRLSQDIHSLPIKTHSLVMDYDSNPWLVYKELEDIGSGAHGCVKKVCLKNYPIITRAMKIIPKDNIIDYDDESKFIEEIEILKNLEHPNIMKIYESFHDNDNVYIISELLDQGDLAQQLEKAGTLNQIIVKFLMNQILNAVAYLHSNRVLHGDIKLENVMLYKTSQKQNRRFSFLNRVLNKNKKLQSEIRDSYRKSLFTRRSSLYIEDMTDYEVKLIDFGCSKFLKKKNHNHFRGVIGTTLYCSPEIIDNLYDEKSDEWACGVLMYILIAGEPPFKGDDEDEIFYNIKQGNYNFNSNKFSNVSESCIDLIKKLLEPRKKNRIKAVDALKHPFLTEDFNPRVTLNQDTDVSILRKLTTIKKLPSKFHEVMQAYLCFNFINKDEEKKLREVFRYLDRREKNRINLDDLSQSFKDNKIEISIEELKNILSVLDSDGNNSIEYQEFLRAMCDKKELFSDKNLKSAFNNIDLGKKGFIDSNDVKQFVFGNKKVSDTTLEKCLKQIGMKMKSKMNFEKFSQLIKNYQIMISTDDEKEAESSSEQSISAGHNDIISKKSSKKINNRDLNKNSNSISVTADDTTIDNENERKTGTEKESNRENLKKDEI